jgi:hypothetical protein
VPTKYFLPTGIQADNHDMKLNDSNGRNGTDCNEEVRQHQAQNGAPVAVRPGNGIYAEWQNGVETFSGHAQRKLRLTFAPSPSPALIHVNVKSGISTEGKQS